MLFEMLWLIALFVQLYNGEGKNDAQIIFACTDPTSAREIAVMGMWHFMIFYPAMQILNDGRHNTENTIPPFLASMAGYLHAVATDENALRATLVCEVDDYPPSFGMTTTERRYVINNLTHVEEAALEALWSPEVYDERTKLYIRISAAAMYDKLIALSHRKSDLLNRDGLLSIFCQQGENDDDEGLSEAQKARPVDNACAERLFALGDVQLGKQQHMTDLSLTGRVCSKENGTANYLLSELDAGGERAEWVKHVMDCARNAARKHEERFTEKQRGLERKAAVAATLAQRFADNASKVQRASEASERRTAAVKKTGGIWAAGEIRVKARIELAGKTALETISVLKSQYLVWQVRCATRVHARYTHAPSSLVPRSAYAVLATVRALSLIPFSHTHARTCKAHDSDPRAVLPRAARSVKGQGQDAEEEVPRPLPAAQSTRRGRGLQRHEGCAFVGRHVAGACVRHRKPTRTTHGRSPSVVNARHLNRGTRHAAQHCNAQPDHRGHGRDFCR